jgi:hypothetical protein
MTTVMALNYPKVNTFLVAAPDGNLKQAMNHNPEAPQCQSFFYHCYYQLPHGWLTKVRFS